MIDTLVDVGFVPPLAWAMEMPGHYKPGRPLKVDKSGRVYGEVLPIPGTVYNRAGGSQREYTVPTSFPDETFSDFHVNYMDFEGEDGVEDVWVGNIAFRGDSHPVFPTQAATVAEAVNHMQRIDRPDLFEQLLAYGRVWRVPAGADWARPGALVFGGCVHPHVTQADRMGANSTTISSDIFPHDGHDGRDQWIGVSRVDRTALSFPIAASLGDTQTGAVRCFINPDGSTDCPEPAVPVQANLTDEDRATLTGLAAAVEQLDARISETDANATRVLEHVMQPEDLNQGERWQNVANRLDGLEADIKEIKEIIEQFRNREQEQDLTEVGGHEEQLNVTPIVVN